MKGEETMAEDEEKKEPSEFTEHVRAASKSMKKAWGSLIPKEFWQHRREARREMLLAMRSLVDGAIDRLEEKEEATKPPTRRKTKVEVTD